MHTSKSYEAGHTERIRPLKLNCFSLLQNDFIPPRYTADGININPSLYVDDIPEDAKSLAIIVEDPDVPHDSFCHWVAWNMPVTHHIKEKENRGAFGINDFCNHGYNGPHPFSITHRYHFKVFALDCLLNIPESSTKLELRKAMKDHIVGFGRVTGKYQKKQTPFNKNGNSRNAKPIAGEELKMLMNERNNICVSIILPLHHLTADQRMDKFHLSNAIKEAADQLATDSSLEATLIMDTLRKLQDEIKLKPGDQGIGIYVSGDVNFHTSFPFQVTEKIIIGKSFLLKELLQKEYYSVPYTLLYIDEKEIRLYHGKVNELTEVKNGEIPMFFEEAAEIKSPLINSFFARNAYVKSLDKTVIEKLETHHKQFLQKASELLHPHLQNAEVLILCGIRKYLSEFIYHTGHTDKILKILYGNYNRFTEADFGDMAWPSVKTYIDRKIAEEINQYNQKLAEGITEEGIVHVWDAISSDRGETLLVEANFEIKGFVEHENPARLFLHPPKNSFAVLPDAVDEIIKMALDKDVNVVFVENGMLNRNMRIALVTKF